jgi:hypothetical protein
LVLISENFVEILLVAAHQPFQDRRSKIKENELVQPHVYPTDQRWLQVGDYIKTWNMALMK